MPGLVLIIDPDDQFTKSLGAKLRAGGFQVRTAPDVRRGFAAALLRPAPDVVILEVVLRDGSGVELCRRLKQEAQGVAVIICSLKGEEIDRIVGFEVGADDYVVKPFVVREVVLRVTALANRLAERRARPTSSTGTTLKVGAIELDPVTHDVRISGAPTQLRPLEYKLLQLLVSDPGRVFSREELLEQVWEMRGDINTRTVDVHVRRLRVSLGPAADVIETVHGFGYRARRDG